jgi:chromosome segregation ATPase
MAELEAAAARLNSALEKLEQRVASLAEARALASRQQAEFDRINAERESLLARIAELEEETRALAGVTEEVELKLDSAIGEIRAALGR